MTIKDLAEMTMTFGLMCQKCVFSPCMLPCPHKTYPPTVYQRRARPSRRTSAITSNDVKFSKTTHYSSVMSSPVPLQTMTLLQPYTPARVVPIAPSLSKTVGSPTSVGAPLYGT